MIGIKVIDRFTKISLLLGVLRTFFVCDLKFLTALMSIYIICKKIHCVRSLKIPVYSWDRQTSAFHQLVAFEKVKLIPIWVKICHKVTFKMVLDN